MFEMIKNLFIIVICDFGIYIYLVKLWSKIDENCAIAWN